MHKEVTRIFLTGATGVMGMAGLREFMKFPEDYHITVLARDSKRNRKKLQPFIEKGIGVIWGDLLDENSLKKGIESADVVLHVGGMVSPMAEHYPEKTLKVNVGSMKSIIKLVEEEEAQDASRAIKVVYIGSVSQYESRTPPNHWGKVGDPLKGAKFDAYAESKIKAEEALVNSRLRKWVSLRQTAILHPGLLTKANDPVTFHVPLKGVIEWVTTEDSGRLLERVSRPDIPDDFWGKCYNVGGGKAFRLTNLEFERGILKALGCPPPEKIFEPNWFATRNFHGMWFEDSDDLDDILHFREPDTFEKALGRLKKQTPWYFKLVPLAPAFIIKAFMKQVASHPELGPLSWIKTLNNERISAAWGSLEEYSKIPSWKDFKEPHLSKISPTPNPKSGGRHWDKGL
ncbi:MAG: NAD(P)-dependent oxidoreductase [Muribaculaceae bacterium]|nr:NAD(P)-dependent oxidoreductase [Muribaculaceae bacterium]